MLSKAHLHMRRLLKIISKDYGVPLLEEVKSGDKRYDFYFPTSPPYVIEVDGIQHHATKPDGHFFKDDTSLLKYKANDKARELENKSGAIKLLRFSSEEFPSLAELYEVMDLHILERGLNDRDIYYKKIAFVQGIADKKKEESRNRAREAKQKLGNGPRFIKK